MRELHVVAVSEDGRHVLLATRKGMSRGDFRVALDDRLAAALRGELPRPGESTAPADALSPKQIQARLRAGESTEQIAASAGVPVARVERFAGPVLSEREGVINGTQAAVLTRSRRGPSGLPLGAAVARHLSEAAGYRPETTTWSARRQESGRWIVQLSYVARAKTRTAAWRYDPGTREVTSLDATSAVLGHVDPAADRRVPARKATKPAHKPAARRPVAKAPVGRKGAAKVPAAKVPAARTRPAPAAKAVTAKRTEASGRLVPAKAAPAKAAPAKAAPEGPSGPPTLRVVPPPAHLDPTPTPTPAPTPTLTPTPAPAPAPVRRAAGARASVPAWADVLLGIAPVEPSGDDNKAQD